MNKKEVVDILKKTGLFLVGVFMVVWGYRANDNQQSEDEAKSEVELQKYGSSVTSLEEDVTEESSGSQ